MDLLLVEREKKKKEGEHRPRTQLVVTKMRSLTSHSPTTQKRKMLGEYLYILFVYLFVKVKNKNNDCLIFLNYVYTSHTSGYEFFSFTVI